MPLDVLPRTNSPCIVLQRDISLHGVRSKPDYVLCEELNSAKQKTIASQQSKRSHTKLSCTPASLAEDKVPLRAFTLPTNWKQTRRAAKWAFGGNTGYDYEFTPKSQKADEVSISIYWDGTILEESNRGTWRQILTSPPHALDESELEFMHQAAHINLANKKEFKLSSAQTKLWNNRMVVETIGKRIAPESPALESIAITFDNYGDFHSAGSISYTAVSNAYKKFELPAMKTLKSINWMRVDKPK